MGGIGVSNVDPLTLPVLPGKSLLHVHSTVKHPVEPTVWILVHPQWLLLQLAAGRSL